MKLFLALLAFVFAIGLITDLRSCISKKDRSEAERPKPPAVVAAQATRPISVPPTVTPFVKTKAWLTGEKKGREQGRDHAKCKGCGMPAEVGFNAMADGHCSAFKGSPGAQFSDCRQGFIAAFRGEFLRLRGGPKIPIRPFLVTDARPGLKLYDTGGNHEMTIIRVEHPLMIVRFVKNGSEEPKDIAAMAYLGMQVRSE